MSDDHFWSCKPTEVASFERPILIALYVAAFVVLLAAVLTGNTILQ